MSLGVSRRLLLWSLVFVAVVDLGVGVYLEARLRGSLDERIRDELTRHVRVAGEVIEKTRTQGRPEQVRNKLDPVADELGGAMEARVSIIGSDGELVADSQVPLEDLGQAGDHRSREEVRAAVAGQVGVSRRHSTTVDTEMLYVAERLRDGSGRVVRVSLPLSQVDAAVRELRWILFLAGLTALAAAGGLAMVASRLMSRSLRTLVVTAQSEAAAMSGAHLMETELEPASVNNLARDLRQTVRLLGAERERFETVLQTMRQAVLALDADRRITTVNRAAQVLLDLPDNAEDRPLLDFVRVPALQGLVAAAGEGGAPVEAGALGERDAPAAEEIEFDYGMSPRRRIQANATALPQGGTVIVMRDVTKLRRLETVRKDFIANVSHELRTPVAVIQANAETLMAGAINDPKRAPVFLDALARHADRMGRLVADLLDISRIEAGRYSLDIVPVDLGQVVSRTVAALQMQAEGKQTRLASTLEAECWVAADDKALEQVLFNLVSNAIKYTQDGGHVEVGLDEADAGEGRLRVEVRDDGPGIDPRHHARVFERFYRVDSGRARDMGGTGLGLAIVKHLVEAMGGQVGVDARRPRGSIFWFTLRTAAAALGDDELEDDGPEGELEPCLAPGVQDEQPAAAVGVASQVAS